MERIEFIEKVFTLYRVNPDNNRDLILIYDDAFSTRKPIDWDKLYKQVLMQAEGALPKPQWFIAKFDNCLKNMDYKTADGLKIRCNLTNKLKYDYETYQCNLTIDEIKNKLQQRFQDKFANMQLFDDYKDEWVTV